MKPINKKKKKKTITKLKFTHTKKLYKLNSAWAKRNFYQSQKSNFLIPFLVFFVGRWLESFTSHRFSLEDLFQKFKPNPKN